MKQVNVKKLILPNMLEITGADRDLTEKEEAQIIEEQNALTALCEKEAAKCSS